MRRFVVVAFGLLLAVACQEMPAEVDEESFVEGVEDTAAVLHSDDWPQAAADDLAVLERCAAAQVVMLGEPDHYIAEKYDYRLVVIRYLVQRGFRWIGMEMGYSDGFRVDNYLETGDPAYLDQVALYGYRGDARPDRDDTPQAFTGLTDTPFQQGFVDAERSFLVSLHTVSETLDNRLHWFGFDIDPFPGGGYTDLEQLLAPHKSSPEVTAVVTRLARVPNETRLEEAYRLDALNGYVEENTRDLEKVLGTDTVVEVGRIVGNLIESLRFRDLAYEEPFGSRWMDGLRYREAALIDRIDRHWPPPNDARVILMGHNFHLSKSGSDLRAGSIAEDGPTLGYPSFGSGVAERMDTCTIWMLYDHGTSANALAADPYFEVASDSERVEHLFQDVGPVLVIDLTDDDDRAEWLDRETNFIANGGPASGPLRSQADVIFFVAEVHAVGMSG